MSWMLILALVVGVVALAISIAIVALLFKFGVFGYYAMTGENDRSESSSYHLEQSRPSSEDETPEG